MTLELLLYIAIAVPGLIIFGHFEAGTPKWRKLFKHAVILGITYALYSTVGRPWSWLWLLFMGALGTTLHFWWTRKHGIHPFTAEPKDKYYALRGWTTHTPSTLSSRTK